ncbi:MAG: isoprenylcysteine carboxylmethyltransferase family protein [Clostridia bacterium]|nr:isoprenylcysteine carboxylmethyltransferase family protein [Clostridia bacterium]
MKEKDHLPLYGIGPVYGAVTVVLTVVGGVCGSMFPFGKVPQLKIPLLIFGILLILYGVTLWIRAVIVAKLDNGIKENRLVTGGVYAHVRNPIYSAILFACTGALCMAGNLLFLPLFFVFWALMTVMMKKTEEKWLTERFGKEYINYCKRVNRAIPWFAKKGDKK